MQFTTNITLPFEVIAEFIEEHKPELDNKAIFILIRDYIQTVAYDEEGFEGAFKIRELKVGKNGWQVYLDLWVDAIDVLNYMEMYVNRPEGPSFTQIGGDIADNFASCLGGRQTAGRFTCNPMIALQTFEETL